MIYRYVYACMNVSRYKMSSKLTGVHDNFNLTAQLKTKTCLVCCKS